MGGVSRDGQNEIFFGARYSKGHFEWINTRRWRGLEENASRSSLAISLVMWGLFSGKLNQRHPQVRRFGGEFETMQEPLLDSLVQAIADRVMAKIRPELSGGVPSSRVQPALFSVKEAAVYLGRSEQAVQHLIFQRDLPVVRVGRRVHLDRRDLDAWIEKNKY